MLVPALAGGADDLGEVVDRLPERDAAEHALVDPVSGGGEKLLPGRKYR